MWPSGDNVVLRGWSNGSLVFVTGRGTVMLFLKIDTSCHIEFLHLSTRVLCKGDAPNSHTRSSLQYSTCYYVRRLRYFNQMIVKMLTCVNTVDFPDYADGFSKSRELKQLNLTRIIRTPPITGGPRPVLSLSHLHIMSHFH